MTKIDETHTVAEGEEAPQMNRRNLLMKLGLAAGAAYAAPVLMSLSEARASGRSRPSRGSGGRGRRRGGRGYGT